MKLLLVTLFAIFAFAAAELKWDENGQYRLIETEPIKYRTLAAPAYAPAYAPGYAPAYAPAATYAPRVLAAPAYAPGYVPAYAPAATYAPGATIQYIPYPYRPARTYAYPY